nr:toll/interleukin-1 receptor domain-containing protein [Bacteroidota bacterium]
MDFHHACFVSYRNGKKVDDRLTDDLLNTFASQVYDALESELQAYFDFDKKVFLDFKNLEPGQFLISVFSEALCRSVAMIVIFTPNYLSEDKLFCASELKGMIEIENNRNNILNENHKDGFIITIVLRGPKHVPHFLKKRVCHDFSRFDLSIKEEIKRHPEFSKTIREIAEKIFHTHERIKTCCIEKEVDLFSNCEDFRISDIDDGKEEAMVQTFINDIREGKLPVSYPQM